MSRALRHTGALVTGVLVAGIVAAFFFSRDEPWALRGDNRLNAFPSTLAAYRGWSAGRIPDWTNDIWAGFPLLADPTSAGLYLPHLIPFLLTPDPHLRAYDMALALHAGLLAAGSFDLLQRLGVRPIPALFGALLTLLGPFVQRSAGLIQIFCAVAWWPWLFSAAEMQARPRGYATGRFGLLGWVALGAQVAAGYPELAAYSGIVAVIWLLTRQGGATFWQRVTRGALCIGGGLAVAAPQALPAWIFSSYTLRGTAPPAAVSEALALHIEHAWAALWPLGTADPVFPFFVGVSVLGLGLVAVLTRRPRALFLLALTVVALVLSLGPRTPAYGLVHSLPGLDRFRGPFKFWLFGELGLTWMAALGLDVLLATSAGSRIPASAVAAIAGLALGERALFALPRFPFMDEPSPKERRLSVVLEQLRSSEVAADAAHTTPPGRVHIIFRSASLVLGHLGTVFGIESLTGGPVAFLTPPHFELLYGGRVARPELLRALGVHYVVAERNACDRVVVMTGFRVVRTGAHTCVLAVPDPEPRYAFAGHARSASSADEMVQLTVGDPTGALAVLAPSEVVTPPPRNSEVRVRAYQPGTVSLETRATEPGLLLVRESWAPGWTAHVDGRPAPTYLAAGIFYVVPVEAGPHVVELTYRTPGLRLGFALSGIWFVGAAAMAGRRMRLVQT